MTRNKILDRFDKIRFYKQVSQDLAQLAGSELKFILKALQRIRDTKVDIGEFLGKRRDMNLSGYRKVKLRKHNLRIIFKKVKNKLIVAKIVTVGKREDFRVYKEALRRIARDK